MKADSRKLVFAVFKGAGDGASIDCEFEPVTCATCRHWGTGAARAFCWDDDGKQHDLPQRYCDRASFPDGGSYHLSDGERAAFVDGSGLLTLPTFGCALWEAKS